MEQPSGQLLGLLIAVENPTNKQVYIIQRHYNLNSIGIFYKSAAKNTFKFVCRESLANLGIGSRNKVKHEDHLIHIQVDYKIKVAAYAFCNREYPERIAYQLLNLSIDLIKK